MRRCVLAEPIAATFAAIQVTRLRGVGARISERLSRLGIQTVEDLLFHLPLRYQDRSRPTPILGLQPGVETLVEGIVEAAEVVSRPRRTLRVWLRDASGGLQLRFFHFSSRQSQILTAGARLRCFGEVRHGFQSFEMVHPEYQILRAGECLPLPATLTPVYPTTEGLQQASLRSLTGQAIDWLRQDPVLMPELLPHELLADQGLPSLTAALAFLHRPPAGVAVADLLERRHPAFHRLAIEELIAHQLSLRRLRSRQDRARAPVLLGDGRLRERLLVRLPFELTKAQHRAAEEIAAGLELPRPMQRLLQGDVGSGKTIVAMLAALQAVESGYQVAMMAPTELLSEQQRRQLGSWLEPIGIEPVWLAGRHKGRARGRVLGRIAAGEVSVVVGTHALFQADVRFGRLGLIIIDEQHRFGVHQRMQLLKKGAQTGITPHQLIMTATPIPRSLAMTLYADLSLSVIDEIPAGRKPVRTVAIPDSRREEVIGRVRTVCAQGRQAYWVCTLIEESEALECQAAADTAEALAAGLPELRVGLVHGRIKAAERDATMLRFAAGEIDLLVATTVIEVGVDVPNASLMIVENPERLGLAQLHQLRGRVGRGTVESHCVLLYHAPLSDLARSRLALLRETSDGFLIARKDLELRGPGEVLGTRQTGTIQFRIADPLRDEALLARAQRLAERVLAHHAGSIDALIARWLGFRESYGQV